MAQLARPYPTPDSKSPCQGLSEFVVSFSGTFHFTRLDSGEQWLWCIVSHTVPNSLKNIWPSFQVGSCSFKLKRNHPALLSIFITDLTLYYLLPLLLSVILYVLIGKTLLSKSRNRLPGGGTRSSSLSTTAALKANQSRVQVGRVQVGTFLESTYFSIEKHFSSHNKLLLVLWNRITLHFIAEKRSTWKLFQI